MVVEISKTAVLDAAEVQKDAPVEATDFQNIMKRVNAEEELILDTACQGGGAGGAGQIYPGHTHDGNGNGRGIMRAVCGGFQIHDFPMQLTWQYLAAASFASAAAYALMFPLEVTFGNFTNYKMGKAWISPGIESFRVEVCIKTESLNYRPQFRVKNLTDTDIDTEYASEWITITTTDPHWYGEDEATEKVTVPVLKSTSLKELDLDIECRLLAAQGSTEAFLLYAAIPYEHVDQLA